MKKGLIFVLFVLVSIVSYSQISWNAKVGMNMSNFAGDADTDTRVGFGVGVGTECQLTDMWSIQPSLVPTQKGARPGDIKANPMYLELPVMVATRSAIVDGQNVAVEVGPYLAYGIAGKYEIVGVGSDFPGDDTAERFDFGLGMDVTYGINRSFTDLSDEFGLVKMHDNDDSPKNINFSIGIGYRF